MMMKNKTYDVLKIVALNILPAIGTLYFALSQIWEAIPYGAEVVGTVTAVTTCIGAILGISSHQYNKAETSDEEGGAEG